MNAWLLFMLVKDIVITRLGYIWCGLKRMTPFLAFRVFPVDFVSQLFHHKFVILSAMMYILTSSNILFA